LQQPGSSYILVLQKNIFRDSADCPKEARATPGPRTRMVKHSQIPVDYDLFLQFMPNDVGPHQRRSNDSYLSYFASYPPAIPNRAATIPNIADYFDGNAKTANHPERHDVLAPNMFTPTPCFLVQPPPTLQQYGCAGSFDRQWEANFESAAHSPEAHAKLSERQISDSLAPGACRAGPGDPCKGGCCGGRAWPAAPTRMRGPTTPTFVRGSAPMPPTADAVLPWADAPCDRRAHWEAPATQGPAAGSGEARGPAKEGARGLPAASPSRWAGPAEWWEPEEDVGAGSGAESGPFRWDCALW
jgi:hypothetical protein